MSFKKSVTESQNNMPKRISMFKENDIKYHLLKDFNTQVTSADFITKKDEENSIKNFGIFDDIIPLMNKNNKKIYYLKIIDKKNIINKSYQDYLNNIYTLHNSNKNINIYDYIINLETQWENKDKLYLIFEGIKKYCSLDELIKNNIKEEDILIIYRDILESINILHENNIFGINIDLNTIIYDIELKKIKLTDISFSKIFKLNNNIKNNKLKNGYEFNEYIPPEFINKMNDEQNINIQEKLKNEQYDIWQLGILFYKIATLGKSPYENVKDEELKEKILDNNYIYSNLNKCPPKIIQIIDKMLQRIPNERYNIKQLLNIEYIKKINNISLNIINNKNENPILNMNIINKEKDKLKDSDIMNLLNNMKVKTFNDDEIDNKENKKNNLLNNIVIQGNIINNKNIILNQEIYPEESVLPTLKKKSLLNKFNNIDSDLVINLANKLVLLDKEYKNIDEIKSSIFIITKYINDKINEKNINDNKEIELLLDKYKNIKLKQYDVQDLLNDLLKYKENLTFDKYKQLISNLIYDMKKLDIDLEHEKSKNILLNNKIQELDNINKDLKLEYQEKVKFYEEKTKLLEDVIFNTENPNMNKLDMINNNKLLYQTLTNSIKNFSEVNIKLKENLEERLSKFKDNTLWLKNIIEAKEKFRNEILYNLNKTIEPKIIIINKDDNKDILNKNKKDEKIDSLTRKLTEFKNLVDQQKVFIEQNLNEIEKLEKSIQEKDKKIDELTKLIKK